MKVTVAGQKPYRLDPLHFTPPLTGDTDAPGREYDPHVMLTALTRDHLLTPLTPGHTATVTDDATGAVLTAEQIGQILATPLLVDPYTGQTDGDTPRNNALAMDLLAQATTDIAHADYPYVRQMFLAQGLGRLGLPAPGGGVFYKAANAVAPPAKELLTALAAGPSPTAYQEGLDAWDQLFTGLGAAYRPPTLGAAFLGQETFAAFGDHLVTIALTLKSSGKIDDDVLDKCRQVAKLDFTGLMQPLRLRGASGVPTDDYSFARLLVHCLHTFVTGEQAMAAANDRGPTAHLLPFDLGELICPETLVLVNAEAHARTNPEAIDRKWRWMGNQVTGGLKILSMKSITKLGESTSRQESADRMVVNARKNEEDSLKRAVDPMDFSASAPPPAQILLDLNDRLTRMGEVNRSQNIQLFKTKSYARANRRRPDNPDVPGRSTKTRYLPDIHYFPDTSGSMSVEDYMDGALFLMQMAKKYDMNFYFSSHSHILAPEILLPVKGKSLAQMRALIQSVPKVGGGNDFTQVYNYIQASSPRRRRLSVMATDFGWAANSSTTFTHPENLVYVPAFNRARPHAWEGVKRNCAYFLNSMRPLDAAIDSRILGMKYAGPQAA